MSPSGVAHGGNDSPQHENAVDDLVLGHLPDGDRQTRRVGALLLQRQLGLRRYETAWMLLHKLRRAMVNTTREPLHGDVEIDDTWIGGPQAGLRGSRQLKGRRAALVLVAVERRGDHSGRVRMAVIPDFSASDVEGVPQGARRARRDALHRRPEKFRLCPSPASHVPRTQPLRKALRRGVPSVGPAGGPRDRQSATLADRHPPRRQPSAAAGLPRRVRVPSQSTAHADGGLSDTAWPRDPSGADTVSPDSWCSRFADGRVLTATSWGLLKQPDKQEPTKRRLLLYSSVFVTLLRSRERLMNGLRQITIARHGLLSRCGLSDSGYSELSLRRPGLNTAGSNPWHPATNFALYFQLLAAR